LSPAACAGAAPSAVAKSPSTALASHLVNCAFIRTMPFKVGAYLSAQHTNKFVAKKNAASPPPCKSGSSY
jgi:hypothetical protein